MCLVTRMLDGVYDYWCISKEDISLCRLVVELLIRVGIN